MKKTAHLVILIVTLVVACGYLVRTARAAEPVAGQPPISATALSVSRTPQETFALANDRYTAGDFQRARELYEEIVADGYRSSELFFNLGNVYFKLNRIGGAVLNYERARNLDPRDPDIQFNLEFARSALPKPPVAAHAGELVAHLLFDWVTMDESTVVFVSAYVIFFAIAILSLLQLASFLRWARRVALVVLILTAGWWFAALQRHVLTKYAIIQTESAQVKNGPGESFTVGFTAPAGTKVLVLRERAGWVEIGLPSYGTRGWISSTDVAKI